MSRGIGKTPDTWPADLSVWLVQEWVGSAEIAEMFGVSRQRAYQLTSRPDFPKPMVKLKGGAVWVTADVIAWAKGKGRAIHEDA